MQTLLKNALIALLLTLTLGCPDPASDLDGDGYTAEQGDCNDEDATVYPQAPDFCDGLDNNCDGAVDPLMDRDGDGAFRFHGVLCKSGNDCDDMDPERYPGAPEVCDDVDHDCDGDDHNGFVTYRFLPDVDGDGHGDPRGPELVLCELVRSPDGYASALSEVDCDDEDPTSYPGAEELCDDVDHDCDGDAPPRLGEHRYWDDADGDGFGAGPIVTTCDPEAPEGAVPATGPEDCDDGDAAVSPEATEVCDGLDNDCDGTLAADEGDADGDGFRACDDCDDGDARRAPGAPEACDGVDNDCDGVGETDGDGDGFLGCSAFTDAGEGLLGGDDCDDAVATTFPGAAEICDAVDQDCDGAADDGLDGDGDGVTPCGADGVFGSADDDCDDAVATTFPGAAEICDGADQDCDGAPAADEVDGDGDGVRRCLDCDDDDPTIFPGAPELCDGRANACGAAVPADEVDPDGDGFAACAGFVDAGLGLLGGGDCAPADGAIFPGAAEVCDGLDDDCDGAPGADEGDADGDASLACQDCDDADPAVFPGAPERCDGRLNDCDGTLDPAEVDGDADGFLACAGFVDAGLGLVGGGDCDDATAAVFPGAAEICDGVDTDCSGSAPSDEVDADGDGQLACAECDDSRPERYVGAPELCDGFDTDCDGVKPNDEIDWDLDGWLICDDYVDLGALSVFGGGDCDGGSQNVHPEHAEACDGRDSDCVADPDEIDSDGDRYIACSDFVDIGLGLRGGEDCAEGDASTRPGAPEVCDAIDNNCDGTLPGSELDGDGDGFIACGDCDDGDVATFPGGTEACDAADNDCDGEADEGFDADADGVTSCGPDGAPGSLDDDCDDGDPAIHPGALELCNAVDDDCDTALDAADADYAGDDFDGDGDVGAACGGDDCDDSDPAVQGLDVDADGESICDGDCDDLDPYVSPSAVETCDGVDTDCDGAVDAADPSLLPDADGDGQISSGCALGGTDCDDRDPHVFAEAEYGSGLQADCAPVVYPGFSHEWSHARISLPSYFFDESTGMHYLYYRAHHDQNSQVIGVSASADGVTWDAPVGPILSPAVGRWDHRNLSNPSVVRVAGAERPYVMLYHARGPTGGLRQIGLASATDPLGPFERIDPMDGVTELTDPVLPPSSNPSYLDSGYTLHPSARYDAASGRIDLWYNGRTASNNTLRVFHAASTDGGLTWIRTDADAIPGPDPIFEPTEGWEGNQVSQITWLEDPASPGLFEYWYTGNGEAIGKASGDEVDWSPHASAPVLTASASCERMDGLAVSARGIRHDDATDTYHWYYGAQSDIGGVGCPGNEDPIYANYGEAVSYVGSASNRAPAVTAGVTGPVSSDLVLTGDVTDNAPDTVVVTVESDVDGFLGTATMDPADGSDFGVQTTGWTLSVTGLSSGAHDLFVDAVDEADTVRTVTLSIIVP
jgi:hypothetical protein